ncbi:DUF6328 family protein [Modestobacter sp. VKM Ac-2984]|uniref:DUF6328 family protein n=1 Tax=Modestobacter sp. VKM Ac-2984 TaxID=3004138 RepID=UPI0022AAB29A|nr:DUF6328 family protein [Modestobacter sp. VKM Ac-2984]MCZ2817898.1 DUF6328 family protein [Modestobacter sp. VKM Ac-2984]
MTEEGAERRLRRRHDATGGETRKERVDRELMELLQELRVALPGVQFLFAFLLIVPFQARATQMSEFQQEVYFTTLVAAAVATGLLIAPAAQHRLLFRQQDKESLLRRSNWSALAGLAVLAVAIASAILLVIDLLFGRTRAWWITGVVAALLLLWWIVVPVWTRMRNPQNSLDNATGNEDSAT